MLRARRRSRWARTFSRTSSAVHRATRAGRSSGERSSKESYGNDVKLTGGGTVIADDKYIRNSILNPASQVVEGYQPIMPTFKGQVTEEQLDRARRVREIADAPEHRRRAAGTAGGTSPRTRQNPAGELVTAAKSGPRSGERREATSGSNRIRRRTAIDKRAVSDLMQNVRGN